jgi:hypothetical protein
MNASVADAHGFSPFEVVFGSIPSLPLDLSLDVKAHSIEELFARRTKISLQVQKTLKTSAETMKKHADT